MEFMPTKGIEYLMVIGYLLLFIPFWLLLDRRPRAALATVTVRVGDALGAMRGWFAVPEDRVYHRGHTWAAPLGALGASGPPAFGGGGLDTVGSPLEWGGREGIVRIGLDDFAQRLVGAPYGIEIPAVGGRLEEGEAGIRLRVGGRDVDLLSPVTGEVVSVNREVLRDPSRLCDDPYGDGWLCEVKVEKPRAAFANLLPAELARSWMESTNERLSNLMSAELGPVLQDGGVPVSGFARELSPDRWHEIAAELLLTAPVPTAPDPETSLDPDAAPRGGGTGPTI